MSLFQEIKKNFIQEDAFENWSQYRKTLTEYLIGLVEWEPLPLHFHASILEETKLPTLGIIGAGGCNDIDLKMLLPYFSRITLIDVDEEEMKHAIKKYGLEASDRIHMKVLSLTGIMETDYEAFTQELLFYVRESMEPVTPLSFGGYAARLVAEQYNGLSPNRKILDDNQYDYVWCFGVHSQLQGMYGYIYQSFLMNLEASMFRDWNPEEDVFLQYLKEQNRVWIPKINDALLSAANRVCVIGNEWDLLKDKQEAYCVSEFPDFGVEGAYQSICDIRGRNLSLKESMIMWPFNENRNLFYQMLIQQITV